MEKLRHVLGDWTPQTGNCDFEARLRDIRKRNGGNIGVFFIYPVEAESRWKDNKTGFTIRPGDGYLELDLLNNADIVRSEIQDSMKGVAHYLLERDDLNYVVGTTYEKMARLFVHFGFTLSNNPLPEDVDNVKRNYPNTPRGKSGKEMGEIYLVFQQRTDVLKRFLDKE